MTRFPLLLIVAALATGSAAYAADSTVVVVSSNPAVTHKQVVEATEKLCRSLITHDYFDDFGTQEECVANAVQTARVVAHAEKSAPVRLTSAK